jgi:hypothetical protein
MKVMKQMEIKKIVKLFMNEKTFSPNSFFECGKLSESFLWTNKNKVHIMAHLENVLSSPQTCSAIPKNLRVLVKIKVN